MLKRLFILLLLALGSLNNAFSQQKMELVIPKGHTGSVKNLLATKDGQYLISGGSDLVNVFDIFKNKLLKSFSLKVNGESSDALQMAFNKLQNKVAIATYKGIFLINLDDLSFTTIPFDKAETLVFSANGNSLYTAGRDGAYEINIASFKASQLFNSATREFINAKLSKDGKKVFFAGEKKLYVYDIASKNAIPYDIPNMQDVLPNGQFFTLNKIDYGNYTFSLYDSQSMMLVSTKNYATKNSNFNIGYKWHWWTFDEKLNSLFVSSEEDVFKYDFSTQQFTMLPNYSNIAVYALTTSSDPDIWYLGFGSLNSHLGVQRYNWKENKILGGILEGIFSPSNITTAKHNNGFVASALLSDKIVYFGVSPSQQKVQVFNWGNNSIKAKDIYQNVGDAASLSPNGEYLIAANGYNKALITEAENPSKSYNLKLNVKQQPRKILYSGDGNKAAIFGESAIEFVDIKSKQQTKFINTGGVYGFNAGYELADITRDGSKVFAHYKVTLGEGGKHIAAWSTENGIKIWDKTLNNEGSLLQLSEDETILYSANNNTLNLIDVANGNLISSNTFANSNLGSIEIINKKGTMVGSRTSIYGSEYVIWDVKTKEKIFQLNEPYVSTMAFLKNDSLLVTSGSDGIKIWDIFGKKELAKIIMYNNSNEYLVITPKGLFDGTDAAVKSLYFVKNKAIISLDSYFETYYTPNLLARILSRQPLADVQDINTLNLQPTAKIKYDEKTRNLSVTDDISTYQNTTGIAQLTVTATAPGDKLDEIRLFHNGKIVNLTTRGLFVTDNTTGIESKTYAINLLPGANNFRAISLNSQRTESKPDQILVVYSSTPQPENTPNVNTNTKVDAIEKNATLHLMVVGINKYKNPSMQLNYAIADAKAFKTEIEKDAASVISNVKSYLVYDDDASKAGIMNAFNEVQKNSKPQDIFMFYYAGHGVISEKNKEFYLVPNNVTDLKNVDAELAQNGIPSKELQNFAININAQKQLFILDACQSAGAFAQLVTNDANQQKNLAVVARSTGTHWIAASGSQQFANEFSQLGHGAFTYVLLQALKGEATKNGMITVNGLKGFLQFQVPELMKKYNGTAQSPSSYGFGNDFPVEILK
jgi:hypothetical protein